ncbi:urease accessory protein UreF [Mesorhizobium sp. ZC-5]|uniref:urease accessory protein UreF n=1 Tax=Mesorhizobium sp. ZC-5 TaxID=2986066 RepID=UPI0021E88212|nr:urease accessory protein UreF [Mesorhizobium sp. ZC-5]MCV3239511.1 urease accessory protein UreF [Mesorhizobium sp. ZC-5]
MTDSRPDPRLLRLIAWLSPAFPVGAFSYSHGLERAVHDGLVSDPEGLEDWLVQLIEIGSGWNDAVLFAESWRRARDGSDPTSVAELAVALAGSRERHAETTLLGAAFLKSVAAWPQPGSADLPPVCPYCVAVGATAGAHGIDLRDALSVFLQGFASNLIQAAIRLGVTGQSGAVTILASLEPLLLETASRASRSTLDDLGSATVMSEIVAMKHEAQYSRLFRS